MFIQALAEYADRELADQLEDEAWEEKPVPLLLAFDDKGTFLNCISHHVQAVRGKKTVSVPAMLSIPRSPVPRNAGLYPLLAADDVKYVLGPGPWTVAGQEENNRERHEAFVALLEHAAADTGDQGLHAAVAFYRRPDQVAAAKESIADAKAGTMIALCLVTRPLVTSERVRSYWSRIYASAKDARVAKGGSVECLISGKVGPVAPTHEKIKGLASLGGQPAGVSLMSFDKDAFCSYGWEQNANSPVSVGRAMAYVLALNSLLKVGGGHRRDIAGVGFIFWTKEKTDLDPMALVDQPEPEQIQRLLRFDRSADPDANMFYMAGVAGNGGRMLIRHWVAETLGAIKSNLQGWFEGLSVADCFSGQISEPFRLWQLLAAIDREGKPPADRVIALLRRAIEGPGQPLGYRILSAALARMRVASGSRRLEAARIGLIRLCLNDQIQIRDQGEQLMTPTLDTGQQHPAYLCGRLMAVYESLQYAASKDVNNKGVNNNVADRYYTLASSYPALAFPKMADLGKTHLRKLRRDQPGAMVRISQEIDQLHLEIEEAAGFKFPSALDLDGQGRFALGYHHQRAHQMSQAAAAKKSKQESLKSEREQENP